MSWHSHQEAFGKFPAEQAWRKCRFSEKMNALAFPTKKLISLPRWLSTILVALCPLLSAPLCSSNSYSENDFCIKDVQEVTYLESFPSSFCSSITRLFQRFDFVKNTSFFRTRSFINRYWPVWVVNDNRRSFETFHEWRLNRETLWFRSRRVRRRRFSSGIFSSFLCRRYNLFARTRLEKVWNGRLSFRSFLLQSRRCCRKS